MCGLTREKDVEAGVEAGLDALGFIFFAKSPRNVEPDFVRDMVARMPPFVDSVGVFVDRERREVEELVEYCGLSHAQLHGKEDPKYCERVERFVSPCRVVKAFRVGVDSKAADFTPYEQVVHGYLLDTYVKGNVGGTGEVFDWKIIEGLQLRRPMILAGGLDIDNVAEAIKSLAPFGVDVNSGVEVAPGVKDYEKLREFVRRVRLADGGE